MGRLNMGGLYQQTREGRKWVMIYHKQTSGMSLSYHSDTTATYLPHGRLFTCKTTVDIIGQTDSLLMLFISSFIFAWVLDMGCYVHSISIVTDTTNTEY